MFSYICPRCGREVPPSYTECPNCASIAAGTGQPPARAGAVAPPAYASPAPAAPAQPSFLDLVQESPAPAIATPPVYQAQPPAPAYQPPPAAYQPPPPAYQPPAPAHEPPPPPRPPSATAPASFLGLGQPSSASSAAAPVAQAVPMAVAEPRRGLPIWLLTVVFAAVFAGLVGGIYWLVDGGSHSSSAKSAVAAAAPPASTAASANPYQKYVEISGVRFLENEKTKKPEVKFVVTNHSGAQIDGLAGTVTVLGGAGNGPKETEGSFHFSTTVGAWESKDMTAPLDTQKQMVELPDWQFVSTQVQVTAPTQ